MLSKKTQYSINAVIRLAKEYNKGPVLIKDISESENIPQKFLEAILLELKNIGIATSKKGKNGGYYLIKDPKDINLADIIRHFNGAIALLPCVTYKYYEKCIHRKDEECCGLKKVIKEIRDKTVEILKDTSIADIIRTEKALQKKFRKKST